MSEIDGRTVSGDSTGKLTTIALWALQILLAANFLFVGGAKLAGMEQMVMVFEGIGIGQWFRYVTGLLEMAGAVLLLVPGLSGIGALGLGLVMIGAVVAELFLLSGNALMPLALLLLLSLVVYGRRSNLPAARLPAVGGA